MDVLKDGISNLQLIQHTGGDTMIVNSARVSFGKRIEKLEDKDRKLIRFLLDHHHGTPLEHTSLTFLVKCPLFVARQWHRHRIGVSINEISGRYVEVKDEFYIPQTFRSQSKSNRQASVEGGFDGLAEEHAKVVYTKATRDSFNHYQELLRAGVAREQARGVLPLSTYTEFYWTCNLRSLFHFVGLRNHADAQWEIQQYAQSMLEEAKKYFPETISIWEELKSK